ncbi:hypothetical protein SK128_009292 [Halocaridina rubra]|uniref:Uncharacterized protein n=1 Tax=Halocaridina rubra TaxID=373956 RepID=A0AAN8WFX3_HALRR
MDFINASDTVLCMARILRGILDIHRTASDVFMKSICNFCSPMYLRSSSHIGIALENGECHGDMESSIASFLRSKSESENLASSATTNRYGLRGTTVGALC